MLFFCSLLLSINLVGQTTIFSDNFNSNFGNWNDGGSDCTRATSNIDSSYAMRLRDNSTSSIGTTDPTDISGFSSVEIEFDYRAESMEGGEDFWLQYNDGSGYVTIASYVSGTDFNNNQNNFNELVTITNGTYTFGTNVRFRFRCDASNNSDYIYIDNVDIRGYPLSSNEIDILGNSVSIADGDTTPSATDHTDFGDMSVASGAIVRTFTIENTDTDDLDISSIVISGAASGDFTLGGITLPTTVSGSSSTSFTVTFDPSAFGARNATITINNNDSDEAVYDFSITGNGLAPEINVVGNGQNLTNGQSAISTLDDTDFGSVYTLSGNVIHTFTIENIGNSNLTISNPVISSGHSADFTISTVSSPISGGGNTTFTVTFDPTADGTRTATISITNGDSDENPFTFDVQGIGLPPAPEIDLEGNGVSIANGDATPSAADDTYFGASIDVNTGSVAHTFTIQNEGNIDLLLNDPSPYISLSGHTADFSVDVSSTVATIAAGGSTTFTITFNPTVTGTRTAVVSIANNDSNEDPYTFTISGDAIDICGGTVASFPYSEGFENTTGLWSQPSTDQFDWTNQTGGTPSNNTGPSNATEGSYYMFIEASSPRVNGDTAYLESPCFDFTSVVNPELSFSYHMYGATINTLSVQVSTDYGASYTATPWTLSGQQQTSNGDVWGTATVNLGAYAGSFIKLRFVGVRGSDYTGDIAIDGVSIINATPQPEINIVGNGSNLTNGQNLISTTDDTDFGSVDTATGSVVHTFTIENLGTLDLTLSNPVISAGDVSEFSVATVASPVAPASSVTFTVTFDPTTAGTKTATISIANNDLDENPFTFDVQGRGVAPLTEGPGGVTANLALWLKSTDGLSYTDGDAVVTWGDQGRGSNATVNTAGQEPTYRDNPTHNVNFNPVIEFDNAYSTYTLDSDFSFDDTSTQFLEGTTGFYTQDIFYVVIPDETAFSNNFGFMDMFCGDEDITTDETDATGLGAGYYSVRFDGEILCYAVGTTNSGDGYGVAEIGTGSTYDNIGIINARNNVAGTQQELFYNGNNIETTQNDVPDFSNVNDSRFWIGRSEGWEASLNARVAEVITFDARKSDTDLTDERNRILSYLGIKYGITLGVNGTSQDYVNSDGNVIWDQSGNAGFNYDVAGIGRDDASGLNQKQSRSVNNAADGTGRTQGLITVGLAEIYDTNKENIATNPTTFGDKEYLVWGNDGADLDLAATTVSVNMSAGISPALNTDVSFTAMQRVWKFQETGGDVSKVKVSIPQASIRNITPPGSYLMFISDTGIFDPTADYRVMKPDGSGNLETEYDFDGTKFVTFGYAPQVVVERSIYFDGLVDYVDMEDALDLNTSGFTISAWIKRDAGSENTSIVSKRDAAYTGGYDFKIDASGHLEMTWKNGSTQSVVSSIEIPEDVWHHVAVIYNGSTATLYIDGVADTTATLTAPTADTDHSFYIAAAGKSTPTSFFRGNIDEVRVWNIALNEEQLRYVVNQEIEINGSFVWGKEIPFNITNNVMATVDWNLLAGYYPMSIFTYTNTNDASNNDNQGALRNLNTVDRQTAPLPYISQADGDWNDPNTWLNGDKQTIPGAPSIVDSNIKVDWGIAVIDKNTIDVDEDVKALAIISLSDALITDEEITDSELVIGKNGGSHELNVSGYLKLDGKIDLQNESQLVQGNGSWLATDSKGYVERDQQGTANSFTYNYWSAPVSLRSLTGNNQPFKIGDVLRDGTNASVPQSLDFNYNYTHADGAPSIPRKISTYWIWKIKNDGNDYGNWEWVGDANDIDVTDGYTMKGTSGSSSVSTEQNYVFRGKPNNVPNGGTEIVHTTFSGTFDSNGNPFITLTGNPFLSAIDADQFIDDNISSVGGGADGITGTLLFWDHFGGGNHNLQDYEGGYATYTKAGGLPAPSHPDLTDVGTGTKTPGRYIPVGQGFFVTQHHDDDGFGNLSNPSSGSVIFRNSQRIFQIESGNANSEFMRPANSNQEQTGRNSNSDSEKIRIWIGAESPEGYHRYLLLAFIDGATDAYDRGFDARSSNVLESDAFFTTNQSKFVIQAFGEFNEDREVPMFVTISDENTGGVQKFMVDNVENLPNNASVYIKDNHTGLTHEILNETFEVELEPGVYTTRFSLVFKASNTLSVNDDETLNNDITVYTNNSNSEIIIRNNSAKSIEKVTLYNSIGQSSNVWTENLQPDEIRLPAQNLSTGVYIINIQTETINLRKKLIIK